MASPLWYFTLFIYLFICLSVCFAQGPLRNTCGHFWLMVWEQKTKAVIMLNRVIEKGSVSFQEEGKLTLHSVVSVFIMCSQTFTSNVDVVQTF